MVNVTFAFAKSLTPEFIEWAKRTYLPTINETGGCENPMILRVASAHEVAPGVDSTYAIQFVASSPEIAIAWLEETLPLLLAKFFEGRDPQSMPYFPTIMEVVE